MINVDICNRHFSILFEPILHCSELDRLEFVLDGGPIENDAPSTVLDLTGTRPSVVRIGVLSIREIEQTTSIKFE